MTPRTEAFDRLTHAEQLVAIRRLAADGLSDRDITATTAWPLDLVRSALGPRPSTADAQPQCLQLQPRSQNRD
jgi:hypothetical protein